MRILESGGSVRFARSALAVPLLLVPFGHSRPVRAAGRNAFRGDDLYDLTLFVERGFHISSAATLTLRAEVFNVTDHENVVGRNAVYGNATNGVPLSTFGQPLGGIANVDPGRQFQLGARVRF